MKSSNRMKKEQKPVQIPPKEMDGYRKDKSHLQEKSTQEKLKTLGA